MGHSEGEGGGRKVGLEREVILSNSFFRSLFTFKREELRFSTERERNSRVVRGKNVAVKVTAEFL